MKLFSVVSWVSSVVLLEVKTAVYALEKMYIRSEDVAGDERTRIYLLVLQSITFLNACLYLTLMRV